MGYLTLPDLRLVEAEAELFALDDYLPILEKQIKELTQAATNEHNEERKKYLKRYVVDDDLDEEWYNANLEYQDKLVFFPRFFRGPFLVALYAVYESIVTEISKEIQEKQKPAIKLDEIRGDFLERAKKYYKQIKGLDLYENNVEWQNIQMLSELRNAVAHSNGRFDIIEEKGRKKIRSWAVEGKGIDISSGYVIVEAGLLKKLFEVIRASLKRLIERFKSWEDSFKIENI